MKTKSKLQSIKITSLYLYSYKLLPRPVMPRYGMDTAGTRILHIKIEVSDMIQ